MAIFNRASEGGGNAYWQDQANMASAATAMLATTDAQDYFGDSLDTNQAFIEHIYLNTLAKDATEDEDGIAYWVGLLDDGTATRGEVVAGLVSSVESYGSDGANYDATDTATVAAYNQFTNRVEVSDYMADTVEEAPEDYATSTAFDGDLTVTDAADTVTSAKASVDALAPSDELEGETYELTTDTDTIEGTDDMDTIEGVSSSLSSEKTLNAGDIIDGGAGADTLEVAMKGSFGGFTGDGKMENVEIVSLTSDSNIARDFDATGVTGVEQYNIDATKAAVNLKDLGDLDAAISISDQAKGTFSVAYATDVTKGTTDVQALAFEGVGTEDTVVTGTIAGVEELDVALTGDNYINFTAAATKTMTLKPSRPAKIKQPMLLLLLWAPPITSWNCRVQMQRQQQ